jgi:D-alanyl-D-alanine carboxypeptidase
MNDEQQKRPSYHFKLIKTDTHHEPTNMMYAKWAVVILFFGISSVSFITQGALEIKDRIFNSNSAETIASDANGQNHIPQRADASGNSTSTTAEALGSDDSTATSTSGGTYSLDNLDSFPRLSARAYIAADLVSGEIIVEQNEQYVAPMASVSKLMTALVAHDQMDMQKYAIVSRDSYNTYGTQGELRLGEKIRVQDLMYPLLMESSNDAAEVIADAYDRGHDAFMAEMNKQAAALGMTDTYYEDPSGLNVKNVSTVRDLMILGRYIHQHAPIIYDMTRVKQYAILKHQWFNKNRFLTYDSFIGGKNGYIDESKKTTVSTFDIPLARGGKKTIIIVLLKSDDREGDALKIINFLKKNAVYRIGA